MTLALNDTAPDFEAETTEGRISFTTGSAIPGPCCSRTRRTYAGLHHRTRLYGQDQAGVRPRGVKIIGLSVDPLDRHSGWAADIEETQGYAPNFPMIADADYNVSKLYGMLPAPVSGDPTKRTPADNQTVRNVFVVGPDKKVKLILIYPMTTGRNFDEVLRVINSLQLTARRRSRRR